MSILISTDNKYGGTYVAAEDLPEKKSDFAAVLNESISNWHAKQIKVVWLKLPLSRAELIPIAYKAGFENHHCDKSTIVMTKKLIKDAVVPDYANHTVGVGGLVINDNNEVLTIREKAHVKTHPHNWKFPGGMLDPYEHIEAAVKREVFEETGIETSFESFIGFRHHHQGQFSTSNIYAVCRLKPLNSEIIIQESEIADAKWFPIDEYMNDGKIGIYNKQILQSSLSHKGLTSINLDGYMNPEEYEVFVTE